MKKLMTLLLSLLFVFALVGCGGSVDDPNAGTYVLTSSEMGGITLGADEVFTGESYIELEGGGDATVCLDGDSISADWVLEDTVFTITIDGQDSVGTLENGVIRVNLLDMGMDFIFEKSE